MAITYNDLYMDIRQELRTAGIQAATLEARELVCYAAGKTRQELMRDARLYVPATIEAQVHALVERHLAGEPVAYLIGEWEFYGLPLDISEHVLIPRPDTEVLAEEAIKFVQTLDECRVLDLCAGSGCVGLAIASQAPKARVVLGELSEGALRICRQNIRRNGLSGQVVPLAMNVMAGPPAHMGEFDCIVSNPPYIPAADCLELQAEVLREPMMALNGGADGYDFYRRIAENAPHFLQEGGTLLMEVGFDQADHVMALCQEAGLTPVTIHEDYQHIARMVEAKL